MNCPKCGARNTADAAWCTQCFTDLRPPAAEPPSPAPAPPEVRPEAQPDLPPTPSPPNSPPRPAADGTLRAGGGRFRQSGNGIEWSCRICESWNPIEVTRCQLCGAVFAESDDAATTTDTAPQTLLAATLALPGLGHILAGRVGTGVARLVVALVWLIGGIALIVSASGADGSILPGVILLLGAAVVWGATFLDVQHLLAGRTTEILDARRMLWLVVGVIGLLTISFMLAAMRLSG